MKIKKIFIEGFRGFNSGQEITINPSITIIYGPNSYGKTSVSEALEWLLFGVTSKVEVSASGKNEFKGTYRNIHYPPTATPFVEMIIEANEEEIIIRGELGKDDSIKRFYNGEFVTLWPWETPELKIYSPFILQHALQDLLLTTPSNRYSRFSQLLGTQLLEVFQDAFNSLATSYNPPCKIQIFIDNLKKVFSQLDDNRFSDFKMAIRGLNLQKVIEALNAMVSTTLNIEDVNVISDEREINAEVLNKLIANRQEEISAIFDKSIVLQDFSEQEQKDIEITQKYLASFITQELIDQYLEYAQLKAQSEYKKQASFYEVGLQIKKALPEKCPFCGAEISNDINTHISKKHADIKKCISEFKELDDRKETFLKDLGAFTEKLESYYTLLYNKTSQLAALDNDEDRAKVVSIFGDIELQTYYDLMKIVSQVRETRQSFIEKKQNAKQAIQVIEDSFVKFHQSTDHISALGNAILEFLSAGNEVFEVIKINASTVLQIAEKFEVRLNALAGTQQLALLIDLLGRFESIKKYIDISQAVNSMKDLRATVTEYVSEKTRTILEDQLTDEVMHWYKQIKTTGDPDVHFSGFSLGGTKARHEISVQATSYGQELVSAVSSLSESKLNALGLSIKISNNIKDGIPFDFLIIDDPVQSLDGDHATQISMIIRKLVEEYGKQIILLSHNKTWLDQLIKGNQSLNGIYYEMTGFDVTGPKLSLNTWIPWQRRLQDVNAICSDTSASLVKLQQAEEEIRLAVCDITSILYKKKTGKVKSSHDLNGGKVRSMLLEAGLPSSLVDRICQTFSTTDDSHHSGENYVPSRERLFLYHSWVHELAKYLNT